MNANDLQVGCKYLWDGTGANASEDQQVVTAIQVEGARGGIAEGGCPPSAEECQPYILVKMASGETELVDASSLHPLATSNQDATN